MNIQQDIYRFPSGGKIFFTSDTHFCHKNIISYAGRPFFSTEEMDKALIENWNSVVPEDGIVFHLGDFCFGGNTQWKTIRKKLNGKIYLILGNHEYYGGFPMEKTIENFEWRIRENVTILNNKSVVIDDTELFFSTLWTHIPLEESHKYSFLPIICN